MPDATAEGFLHIIFDTFFFFLVNLYLGSFLCDVFRTGGCCPGGQSRQFKANTGLPYMFYNSKQTFYPKTVDEMLPFGAVCVYEKQYVYLKRNQPFVFTLPYQGSLSRGKLPDGWFYISGHGARTETPSGFRSACWLQ